MLVFGEKIEFLLQVSAFVEPCTKSKQKTSQLRTICADMSFVSD